MPRNDGRRRPLPVPGERQQAGSAVLGGRVGAPSGKYAQCKVKDRGNWSCPENAGQPPTIAHEMVNGRPRRDGSERDLPFHAVPKWVWWVLDAGLHVYNKAGY